MGFEKATWRGHDWWEGRVRGQEWAAGRSSDVQTDVPRHVAVSTAVVTQQLVSKPTRETPRARPCRVSTADRKVRKGVMAQSLEDLLVKVRGLLCSASALSRPRLRVDAASCFSLPGLSWKCLYTCVCVFLRKVPFWCQHWRVGNLPGEVCV